MHLLHDPTGMQVLSARPPYQVPQMSSKFSIPTSPSLRRKTARNRAILRQYKDGVTLATISEKYGLSVSRLKEVVAREVRYLEREMELMYALSLPDQPNALLLSPTTRAMVAAVVGRSDFKPADVLAVGPAAISRLPGFYAKHKRELARWLGLPAQSC
jgi:hypothetical protein